MKEHCAPVYLKKHKKKFAAAAVCVSAVLLLYYNDILTLSVKNSVYFCLNSIIPALFPFLLITEIITRNGIYPKKSHLLSGLFLGIVCGFPSGAKFAHSLYRNGMVSKKKAEYINAVSNNAGISFSYGFTASALGVNGFAVMMIQVISVLISCIILRFATGKDDGKYISIPFGETEKAKRGGVYMTVRSALGTMAMICAFITVFSAISDIICSYIPNEQLPKMIIRGFFEISGGIKEASAAARKGLVYACSILCWSGLCVCFQIRSVIKDDLSIKPYLLAHLIQSASAAALAFIYLSL
ncbi:MAG: hypothetical protein IJS94_06565 [Clostridia bacterium]|nr:hypothetical protein [Clostridia bacterium]